MQNLLLIILLSLIELLKKDKQKGVTEILKKYMPDILQFLKYKLSGNIEMAEELFQETVMSFIKAVKTNKAIFLTESNIKNYLFTIAMNHFRNNYKKNKHIFRKEKMFNTEEELENSLNNYSNVCNNPEELAIQKDEKNQIENAVKIAMSKMPDNYKNILKLKFNSDKTNNEIALELKISVKAAESLLFRAKQAFKNEFLNISLKDEIFTNLAPYSKEKCEIKKGLK